MAKEIISTDVVPKSVSGSYSQAVKSNGLIFVSGQAPVNTNWEVVGTSIQEQTAQCLRNIEAILKASGSSLEKAVSATFVIADESDFAGMDEEWDKWFGDAPPARQGSRLSFPDISPKLSEVKIAVWLVAEA